MPRAPSLRSMLAASVPFATYATKPEARELVEALRCVTQDPAAAQRQAAQLVERWDLAVRWHERCDALRCALTTHYYGDGRVARLCRCKSCAMWRAELQSLFDDRGAHDAHTL